MLCLEWMSLQCNVISYYILSAGVPRRPASAAGGEVPPPHPVAIANAAIIAAGVPPTSGSILDAMQLMFAMHCTMAVVVA